MPPRNKINKYISKLKIKLLILTTVISRLGKDKNGNMSSEERNASGSALTGEGGRERGEGGAAVCWVSQGSAGTDASTAYRAAQCFAVARTTRENSFPNASPTP